MKATPHIIKHTDLTWTLYICHTIRKMNNLHFIPTLRFATQRNTASMSSPFNSSLAAPAHLGSKSSQQPAIQHSGEDFNYRDLPWMKADPFGFDGIAPVAPREHDVTSGAGPVTGEHIPVVSRAFQPNERDDATNPLADIEQSLFESDDIQQHGFAPVDWDNLLPIDPELLAEDERRQHERCNAMHQRLEQDPFNALRGVPSEFLSAEIQQQMRDWDTSQNQQNKTAPEAATTQLPIRTTAFSSRHLEPLSWSHDPNYAAPRTRLAPTAYEVNSTSPTSSAGQVHLGSVPANQTQSTETVTVAQTQGKAHHVNDLHQEQCQMGGNGSDALSAEPKAAEQRRESVPKPDDPITAARDASTPREANITLLGTLAITAEEILTFFPNHTLWPWCTNRLLRNGWKGVDITAYKNYARNLTGAGAFLSNTFWNHHAISDEAIYGRRYAARETRPDKQRAVNDLTPGWWATKQGSGGTPIGPESRSDRLRDMPLKDLALGVVNWPDGPGRGPLTQCIEYALNHPAKTIWDEPRLSDVLALVDVHSMPLILNPTAELDKESRARNAARIFDKKYRDPKNTTAKNQEYRNRKRGRKLEIDQGVNKFAKMDAPRDPQD